jgi:hypothetical protein
LAGQGSGPAAAGRKVFRHHCSTREFLLDSRRLFDPVKEDEDLVFFLDAANPESDSADTGSFYNKAPRISAFLGDAFDCEAIK